MGASYFEFNTMIVVGYNISKVTQSWEIKKFGKTKKKK